MGAPLNVDWSKARQMYINENVTLAEVARKFGIIESTVYNRALREKWKLLKSQDREGFKIDLKANSLDFWQKMADRTLDTIDSVDDKLLKQLAETRIMVETRLCQLTGVSILEDSKEEESNGMSILDELAKM